VRVSKRPKPDIGVLNGDRSNATVSAHARDRSSAAYILLHIGEPAELPLIAPATPLALEVGGPRLRNGLSHDIDPLAMGSPGRSRSTNWITVKVHTNRSKLGFGTVKWSPTTRA